jgi:hypothetical protein
MDRMRIDPDADGLDDRTPALDRAWAATRPAELSADEFERIWAEVRRAYDEGPATLTLAAPPARARRRLALVAFGLAQLAAGLLVAAWLLNRTDDGGGPVVRDDPAPAARPAMAVARHDIDVDETLIIRIVGGTTSADRRPAPEAIPTLAMNDLPSTTPSDVLGFMEAQSR